MDVPSKNMDNPMLNFFGHLKQIHVIAAARGTFHLNFITVILMEPLKALYEQEVYRQPCNVFIGCVSGTMEGNYIQIGPRQLELPPNIPDLDSPGQ